jgi:hypothetical protein
LFTGNTGAVSFSRVRSPRIRSNKARHAFGGLPAIAMLKKLRLEPCLSHAEEAGFQRAPNFFASVEEACIVNAASMMPHSPTPCIRPAGGLSGIFDRQTMENDRRKATEAVVSLPGSTA